MCELQSAFFFFFLNSASEKLDWATSSCLMKTREIWGTGNKSENVEIFSLGGHKQRIPQVFLALRCHQERKTQSENS